MYLSKNSTNSASAYTKKVQITRATPLLVLPVSLQSFCEQKIYSSLWQLVSKTGKARVFRDQCPGKEMESFEGETEGNCVATGPNYPRQCSAALCVSKDQIHKATHQNYC